MEQIIRFKIDEKSLFYGVTNDFAKGHTATVSTPLNQSKDPKKWHNDVLKLVDTNARIDAKNIPDRLIAICQKDSKSENIIRDVFIFDKIYVDGVKIETEYQYIMYIKKETAKYIKSLNTGKMTENTHLGRLKLHYPITFSYVGEGYKIDNKKILEQILKTNKNYAYIVRGFEYNVEDKSLNFITSLLGPENSLLSTIFRIAKGTGKKLRIDTSNITTEGYIVYDLKGEDDDVIDLKYEKRNKTSRENGKKGENYIYDNLVSEEMESYHTSTEYPESPYDMEFVRNGKKYYVEVKSTQSDKIVFNMSNYEFDFMEKYKEQYLLYVVTNVKDEFPSYQMFRYNDIMKMKKEILRYRFSMIK